MSKIDWTKSMEQSYEYYLVNPHTWRDYKKINTVISCDIEYDSNAETLGSANISIDDILGESYIRPYIILKQDGVTEKRPLGTFLMQTPTSTFDGMVRNVSVDAYTPLIELKENKPELGYYIPKGENIVDYAYRLTRNHLRAPVVDATCPDTLRQDFVSNVGDTWLNYLTDLLHTAKFEFSLDEMCRILFAPIQEAKSLQPIFTFNDNNSSILLPQITLKHDIYGIPNVVEVIYSVGSEQFYARVVNDDPNSPLSTVNRGREILERITDANFGNPTKHQVEEFARNKLKELSTVEYEISYSHGYCPVRVGDCVRLNYKKAGISNVNAKVIRQSMSCVSGCTVNETAIFSTNLWR